ncbi:MAG TPA: YIP1 family protein [Syntrophomonadaceae bacterium]|nr:YIP1 family protein [Syntrophomonadaceae bacterium]HQA06607.1 YIP1 family protein [Syntrophomonadaceae bacterium]HQE22320.1 YIP1 family protein [Syntrophomonadaceae bacterium]
MSVTESIYGVLFEPVTTLRTLAVQKPYGRALLIFLAVTLLSLIFEQALMVYNDNEALEILPANAVWMFNILGTFLSVLLLLVISGLLSLISEIIYGKFNAGGILVTLCYASVPGILGPPIHYAFSLAGQEWLGSILALLAMVWVLILQVIGVRESLQVTTGQAILIMVLPGLFTLIMITSLVVVVLSGMN